MAAILDGGGMYITQGLQGCYACDEAILCAKEIADQRGEPVYLEDDDGQWIVYPVQADGSRPGCTQIEETETDGDNR